MQDICSSSLDCLRHLKEPGLKLMRPAACVLQAVARGSYTACCVVLDHTLPALVEQLPSHTGPAAQRALLQLLLDLIRVSSRWSGPGASYMYLCFHLDLLPRDDLAPSPLIFRLSRSIPQEVHSTSHLHNSQEWRTLFSQCCCYGSAGVPVGSMQLSR